VLYFMDACEIVEENEPLKFFDNRQNLPVQIDFL